MSDQTAPTPRPAPVPRPLPGPPSPAEVLRPGSSPASAAAGQAVQDALARLGGLDALGVHEHVEVYAAVDRALRERLAATEG